VLLEETGVASVIDPLGGSWFVEASTDRVEQEAEQLLAEILALGDGQSMTSGIVAGIDDGWFTGRIADAADEQQRALEEGRRHLVGVTAHTSTVAQPLEVLRIDRAVETAQVERLAARRSNRDADAVASTLAALTAAARTDANLVPPMLDAARAEATVGEICDALREVFGSYAEPPRF
jgi:methylmalonyl-CoA mutase N-terminal domain/subunit